MPSKKCCHFIEIWPVFVLPLWGIIHFNPWLHPRHSNIADSAQRRHMFKASMCQIIVVMCCRHSLQWFASEFYCPITTKQHWTWLHWIDKVTSRAEKWTLFHAFANVACCQQRLLSFNVQNAHCRGPFEATAHNLRQYHTIRPPDCVVAAIIHSCSIWWPTLPSQRPRRRPSPNLPLLSN